MYVLNAGFMSINGISRYATNAGRMIISQLGFNNADAGNLTCTGGDLSVGLFWGRWSKSIVTVSGGNVTVNKLFNGDGIGTWDLTGGAVEINGKNDGVGIPIDGNYTSRFNVSSNGRLRLNCHMKNAKACIYQSGGTVEIFKSINCIASTSGYNYFYQKTGGELILNGATLTKNTGYTQFINCPTSTQTIKVYSGGVTTNGTVGDLLSAKKEKDSLIVTAVAITTIKLKTTGGVDTTITETDIATYNTTALMAQRIASLINSSSTIYAVATYASGATLNIEARTAGTIYGYSGLINMTATKLRLNTYAITDLVGGSIIEDSDVTY